MKKARAVPVCVLCAVAPLWAAGPDVSGFLDSKALFAAGSPPAAKFFCGVEEYANIRLQSKIREKAVFYGSFNLLAVSGIYAKTLDSQTVSGANYAAAMELERLYVRLNGEKADMELGLMRLGFGYGQVFAPVDFLNPANPLFPDARPRGILGTDVLFYPSADSKITAFAATPKDPADETGRGAIGGLAAEYNWPHASLLALYAYETPGSAAGLHRAGLSLKADIVVGANFDMLCVLGDGIEVSDGLAASAGVDYSFLGGDLYVLAAYLYSGASSSMARSLANPTGYANRNYLYGSALYKFNDYNGLTLGCIAGLDDGSFVPIIQFDSDLSQGIALTLQCQIPLDRNDGEFGTAQSGSKALFTARLRVRF